MSSSTSFPCRLFPEQDFLVAQAFPELGYLTVIGIENNGTPDEVEVGIVLTPQDARRLATNLIIMANEVEYD